MQINARDWHVQVAETPGGSSFTEVHGLESFSLNPSEGEESADTTTFDSKGHAESQAMQRGASLALSGKAVRTGDGSAPDPGQLVCDTLATRLGEASLGAVRFRHETDDEWTVWTAWCSKGENAGGTNDKTSWSATFTRSGVPTVANVSA